MSTSIEDLFTYLLYHLDLSVNLKRRNSFDLGFGIETVMRVSKILIEEDIISKERAKPKDNFKYLSLRLL